MQMVPVRNTQLAIRPRVVMPSFGTVNINSTPGVVSSTGSELRVKGEEFCNFVKSVSGSKDNIGNYIFWPGSTGSPRLDQYATMFDLYKVNSVKFMYRSSSGTTTSGAILAAIDYDPSITPSSTAALSAYSPRVRGPVWQNMLLTADASKCMKSKWLRTSPNLPTTIEGIRLGNTVACSLLWSTPLDTTVKTYGDMWVEYDITFASPATRTGSTVASAVRISSNTLGFPCSSSYVTAFADWKTYNLGFEINVAGSYELSIYTTSTGAALKTITDIVDGEIEANKAYYNSKAMDVSSQGMTVVRRVIGLDAKSSLSFTAWAANAASVYTMICERVSGSAITA